jgi:acetate kinase
VHRLRGAIAAMAAAMNGIDVLVFTGGVGENHPRIRDAAASGVGFLGVGIDQQANAETTADGDITRPGSSARTVVVTAREDLEIAREVRQVVNGAERP